MKKIILTTLLMSLMVFTLSACSIPLKTAEAPKILTPDDFEPIFYLTEEELPENAYYIAHDVTEIQTDKEGNPTERTYTKYYPLHQAEKTYSEKRINYAGYDFNRVVWVNYSIDEGLIPTMYKGDRLIYKSSTFIPTKYALEKFFDNGYTFGVCGLEQDLSKNYKYTSHSNSGIGAVLTTSDAAGFEGLEAESIYFVSIANVGNKSEMSENMSTAGIIERITPANVSMSGTISGLNLLDTYDCDIRVGTERILAPLCCNVHYFSSAETYMFGEFTFITPIIAEINLPSYAGTGYYEINDGGLFRYAANNETITDWHQVTADLCNDTIYIYDEECKVCGTTLGLVFDENGFLREPTALDVTNTSRVHTNTQTYEELLEVLTNGITVTTPTSLTKDSGYYYDNYIIDVITDKTMSGSYTIYEFSASSNTETIEFYYKAKSNDTVPMVGDKYQIIFKEPTVGSIKRYVVTSLNKAREE